MNGQKLGLIVLVVLGGLGRSAQAQQGNAPDRCFSTYPGAGTNGDYYSITNNFGPYNLPGTYPKYQGYGLSGYGPGAILNEYFVPWPGPGINSSTTSKPGPIRPTAPKPLKSASDKPRVAASKGTTTRKIPGKQP